jgi:hypothetical protein
VPCCATLKAWASQREQQVTLAKPQLRESQLRERLARTAPPVDARQSIVGRCFLPVVYPQPRVHRAKALEARCVARRSTQTANQGKLLDTSKVYRPQQTTVGIACTREDTGTTTTGGRVPPAMVVHHGWLQIHEDSTRPNKSHQQARLL